VSSTSSSGDAKTYNVIKLFWIISPPPLEKNNVEEIPAKVELNPSKITTKILSIIGDKLQ
jgi:hypothetical protein